MRGTIKLDTLKVLLARSGNQCAFPECKHPLFNEGNLFIAQLAHIEGVSPNGPRFNSQYNNEQLNNYDNLIFLCYRHHKEIDSSDEYSVDRLKELKSNHERKFQESNFSVPEKYLESIQNEITQYWKEVYQINNFDHTAGDFKIDINHKAEIDELFEELRILFSSIDGNIESLNNDLRHEYFEILCLAIPNCLSRINVIINQLEIKFYEQSLINNPYNDTIKQKLDILRIDFKDTARNAGIVD